MSEDAGAALPPWVLDVSIIAELARGDWDVMTFVQRMDADGRLIVIPVLAMAGASLDMRSEDASAVLRGLGQFGNAVIVPAGDADQAVRLAEVVARTELDPWNAHVAAVADAEVCAILTLDGGMWRDHLSDLDEPLAIIEIAEPDEG